MHITLARTINGGISNTMSQKDYDILSRTNLKSCPFPGYTAIDLLHDLECMYSWTIKPGISVSIDEFLTLCNDAHAEAYRSIFVNQEAI